MVRLGVVLKIPAALILGVTLAAACADDEPRVLTKWDKEFLRQVYDRSRCAPSSDLEGLLPDPGDGVAGVPFPPFEGGRVTSTVPLNPYPGSVLVDGFVRKGGLSGGRGKSRVQVYQVAAEQQAVLDHFHRRFQESGWMPYGGGFGVSGLVCTYCPVSRPRVSNPDKWAKISTEYVGRDDPPAQEPPPGFRGKGVPFAPRTPGTFTYYVVTPD
ncbi:MAG: hypothetical protein ACKVVT_09645 [Dehalococcoidia bacterium]